MPKLKNIVAPSYIHGMTNGYGLLNGNSSLQRFVAPNYNSVSEGISASGLLTLSLLDVNRCKFAGNYNNLKIVILRNDTAITSLPSSSILTDNLEEVRVPQSMIETYKTNTNWAVHADKILPLEGSKYESVDWYKTEDWYLEEMAIWQTPEAGSGSVAMANLLGGAS
jgi:hypothetical protein